MKQYLLYFLLFLPILAQADWAQETLNGMSLKQKVGQLVMPQFYYASSIEEQDIKKLIQDYGIGGVLLGGSVVKQTPCEQAAFIDVLQALSTIPLLIAQDLEWGLAMRLKGVVKFPHNMTLAALPDTHLIYELGKEIGRQCKLMGVHINFAPVVDINSNPKNPVISDRAFGACKEKVTACALEYMYGMHQAGIISCAKHFPGHGDTSVDSHYDLPVVHHCQVILEERELYPFNKMIEYNVPMVMTGHLSVPAYDPTGCPASLSKSIVTDLLKNTLGFKGIAVTDGLRMGGISNNYSSGDAAVRALSAGNDLLIDCACPQEALEALVSAVEEGRVSQKQLDESVLKILRLKESLGLTVYKKPVEPTPEDFHTPYAYHLKGKLYQQAVTVVRDTHSLIPCKPSDSLAAVFIEDEKSYLHKHLDTTLYLAYGLNTEASQAEVAKLVSKLQSIDTVVVSIFGMNKYIHKQCGMSDQTLAFIKSLQQSSKKVIVILFGTPYAIPLFDDVGTVIVAYEDDIDAQFAAAKVVIGKLQATGTLPI